MHFSKKHPIGKLKILSHVPLTGGGSFLLNMSQYVLNVKAPKLTFSQFFHDFTYFILNIRKSKSICTITF